ncbi:hypothetical protein PoB_004972600, partial [Plakobranchus ocellatus]
MIASSIRLRAKSILTLGSCRNLIKGTTLMKRSGSFPGNGFDQADVPGPSSRKSTLLTSPSQGSVPRTHKKSIGTASSTSAGIKIKGSPSKRNSVNNHRNSSTMPPIGNDVKAEVEKIIKDNALVVFSKTTCPFCIK